MPGKGKVTGGLLDEPISINSRADVNRARVLPQVRAKREAPAQKTAPAPAPSGGGDDDTSQPKSGFDYVVKRNRMMKRISGRANGRSGVRRA